MKPRRPALAWIAAAMFLPGAAAVAHHSYSMFDLTRSATVEGKVAKIEWKNPHTFVWVYVKKPGKPGAYDLWGFENGPVGLMQRLGWSPESLKGGEKIVVQYFPLRDGRTGGHFVRALRADGTELAGDPYAPGVEKELAKGKLRPDDGK